jgi:putative CocE/NonD family hydrolase
MNKRLLLTLTGLSALGVGLYRQQHRLLARYFRLPPPRNSVMVLENQRVAMTDGVTLATDLFLAQTGKPTPTILIRTPYGRPGALGVIGRFVVQRFAERGYNVVVQDVRGRFDSEGEWEPYTHEAADGASTLDWIVQQAWSDGQVGMWGQSYVGYTLWAAASTGSPHLKALVPVITQAFLAERGDGYQLDRTLRWLLLLDALGNPAISPWERIGRTTNAKVQNRLLAPGFTHLPLSTVDEAILGKPVPFYRQWLERPALDDPYWLSVDFRDAITTVNAPVHLVAGWYDIFLEGQVNDYHRLRATGHTPYLTIGPWVHLDTEGQWESIRQALAWFDVHLKGDPTRMRPTPVRLYVMGANEWRDFTVFPPVTTAQTYYLQNYGDLASVPPSAALEPDRYRYDPADPTPNVGGALLSTEAGAVDNRTLEARGDVLTYTSPTLTAPLEIIGQTRVVLWVESSVAYTDFFARLTVVHPDGRSVNIADGLYRVQEQSPNTIIRLEILLAPTAFRFTEGQKIRLQISSGAHPRIFRNLGTGDPEMTGDRMVIADQVLYHDADHPSLIELPLYSAE